MGVYQFKMWGRNFAVDVESGNFFETDKLASEAIIRMPQYTRQELIQYLRRKYKNKSIEEIVTNLYALKKKKILFSERQKNESSLKRKITDITLNVVNTCNLRCRYCWNQAGAYGSSSGSMKRMNRQVAFKAVDLLIKESKGADDLVVDFYGGEPLLNHNLIKDVIDYCRGIQRSKKINFRFLLATNGTLLNKERGEFLVENGVDVAVSLDGSRKIQDTQRPFPDGSGSYDLIVNNITALKKDYRRRLVGRATFTPYSTGIIRTFKFLRNFGFDRIEVCESEKAGYGLETNNQNFFNGLKGLHQLKSLYYKLALFYTEEIIRGSLTYENTYFNRFFKQLSRLNHIQSIVGTCSAGFSLMAVDIDGSIYPCTAFVGLPQFQIGHVRFGIDEKKLKGFSDTKISSSEACDKCWAKRLCRGCGSCYNLNYFSNNNLAQPDSYYCELFRYKTKLMMAMIAEIGQKSPQLLDDVLIPEYYAARGRRNTNEDKKNPFSQAS